MARVEGALPSPVLPPFYNRKYCSLVGANRVYGPLFIVIAFKLKSHTHLGHRRSFPEPAHICCETFLSFLGNVCLVLALCAAGGVKYSINTEQLTHK